MTYPRKTKSYPTYTTKEYAGVIVGMDGVNKVQITAEKFYTYEMTKHFKVGDVVTVYVTSRKPKRTVQQNRYYWMYLEMVSRDTGNEVDVLHNYFSGEFLTDKIVTVYGHQVRMKKSTTNLTRPEFVEYLLRIEAQTGIPLPSTDNYHLPQLK